MNIHETSPLVTAVVTTYNRPRLARVAIHSVLAQTYQPVEVIVVEDGSSSGIREWLQDEGLDCVRYVCHEQNKGLAAARNTGLRLAHGKYVAYVDDDDEWLEEKLEEQVALAESDPEECEIYYCGTFSVTGHNYKVYRKPNVRGYVYGALMSGWTPPQSACLFRTQALREIEGFDEALVSGIDHDVWMKCAFAGYKADFVDDVLVKVGSHSDASRMTLDTSRRISGINTFLEKWKLQIQDALGEKGYQRFRACYLSREYEKLGTFMIRKGSYRSGLWNLALAARYNPLRPTLYFKLLLGVIGGKYSYAIVTGLRHGFLFRGHRHMEFARIPGIPKCQLSGKQRARRRSIR